MIAVYFSMLIGSWNLQAQERWDLQKCIEVAIEKNKNIAIGKLDVASKMIDVNMAKNERLPSLNGFSNVASNFGQSQDIFGNNARNDNFNSTIGLSSAVSLVNFGRHKQQVLKSALLVNASKEEVELQKRQVRIQVAQAYLQVLLQQEMARLIDSSSYFSELQVQKVQKSTDLGYSALSVLYEAKANHSRDVQKLAAAQQEVEKAILGLTHLLNLNDSVTIILDDNLDNIEQLSFHEAETQQLLHHVFDTHPLLRKYNYINEAILADNKVLKTGLYPSIDLGLNIGSFYFNNLTSGFGKLPFIQQMQGNFSQQITLSMNIPIYNKRSVKHGIQKNNNQLLQNIEQLGLAKQQFQQEMERYLVDYQNYKKQLVLNQEALETSRLAFDISQKSFDAGKISIYDLNNSRANLLAAESDVLQIRYNMLFSKLLVLLMAKGEI